jgi:hypothetical protein
MLQACCAATPRAVYSTRLVNPEYGAAPLFLIRHTETQQRAEVCWIHGEPKTCPVLDFNEQGPRENFTPLDAFLADASAFVETWYDQSGNGSHATQLDPSAQPFLRRSKSNPLANLINNSNTFVVDFHATAFLRLPDGTVPYLDAPYTVLVKHGPIKNLTGGILGSGLYGSRNICNAFRRSGDNYVNYWWNNDAFSKQNTYAQNNIVAFSYNRGKRNIYVNGEDKTQCDPAENATGIFSGTRFSSPENNTLGVTNTTEFLNGELEFLYILDNVSDTLVSLKTGTWHSMEL